MTEKSISLPNSLRLTTLHWYSHLLGRDLLIAPVVEPCTNSSLVYLPSGTWRDLWTGEAMRGGQTIQRSVPFDRMPVFDRDGAKVPLYLPESKRLGDYVGNEVQREPSRYLGSTVVATPISE